MVLDHCITYAYHVLRADPGLLMVYPLLQLLDKMGWVSVVQPGYGAGYNTVKLTWEALRIVQD